ncbi:MAG: plasmid partitioning protein RepB [Paracoccaceae bacterium]
MARKSLQDLSGIANAIARSGTKPKKSTAMSKAPALGALQGSLSAIREIDPDLIDDWGPRDRLDEFTAVNSEDDSDGFDALKASILENGQQVPILVRRTDTRGRFESIYGRRRLKACRDLGIKVKANVQEIDDTAALLAKGLENAARRNLSFYEKARFAAAIQSAGHDNATVRKVLNLSPSGLSHLTKVTDGVPKEVGELIGAAPKSGRPKWTSLAEMFETKKIGAAAGVAFLSKLDPATRSDDRLDLLLKDIARRGARLDLANVASPVEGVTIRSGRGSIAVTITRVGENAAFADWLDVRLEDIIKKSYQEFTAVNSTDDTRGQSRKEEGK